MTFMGGAQTTSNTDFASNLIKAGSLSFNGSGLINIVGGRAIRIALIAPPFIPVPPIRYGGTELFVAGLAEGLMALGHDVVVYANGESEISAEVRWLYPKAQWPIMGEFSESLKEMTHTAWATRDAADSFMHWKHFWITPLTLH